MSPAPGTRTQPRTMDELQRKPLAFSSDKSLISASSRIPLETSDGQLLNVELFCYSNANGESPILLHAHGVCESNETLGLQAIVEAARFVGVKVAALELEGHGLSDGNMNGSFEKHLRHVLEFVGHSMRATGADAPYFLCGNSLGGVLSLYAAEVISGDRDAYPPNFKGVATICPAVGVDPRVVPSEPVVFALSVLSGIAPSLQVALTPFEDPSSYSCPPDTDRNFEGHWPLATSKMLLDVTSKMVKADLVTGKLSLKSANNVLTIAGKKDHTVPFDVVKAFHDFVSPTSKEFFPANAGHDMMFRENSAKVATDRLFSWIASILGTNTIS